MKLSYLPYCVINIFPHILIAEMKRNLVSNGLYKPVLTTKVNQSAGEDLILKLFNYMYHAENCSHLNFSIPSRLRPIFALHKMKKLR